jgi:serine/threonine protein kinase
VFNFLIQPTAALCYLRYGFESYIEAATSDIGQVPGLGTVVHTDIRPDQVFLQTPSHERFPIVKLGDFGLAMPLKVGVLVTTH